MSNIIKRKVEEHFFRSLGESPGRPPALNIYLGRDDEPEVRLPYVVGVAMSAGEILPRSNVYRVEYRIVVMSDGARTEAPDHDHFVGWVKEALDGLPREIVDQDRAFRLHGFAILECVPVEDEETQKFAAFGDVFTLRVGASLLSPGNAAGN